MEQIFTVDVQIATAQTFSLDLLIDLMEAVTSYSGAVGGQDNRYGVQLDIEAPDLPEAGRRAVGVVTAAAAKIGLPPGDVVSLTVQTLAEQERVLDTPELPELVGAPEAAALLGVSRQRVHQLATREDFPAPLARLGAGSVWDGAAIRSFNERWDRKGGWPLGRPRAAREAESSSTS